MSSPNRAARRALEAFFRRDVKVPDLDLSGNTKKTIFIRHGQSMANSLRAQYREEGRIEEYLQLSGDLKSPLQDPGLNEIGVKQARDLGAELRSAFPGVFASGRFSSVCSKDGLKVPGRELTSNSTSTLSTAASSAGSSATLCGSAGSSPSSNRASVGSESHDSSPATTTAASAGAVSETNNASSTELWVSPMRRTIETAQNVFFEGEKGRRFDALVPDAREYFADDFSTGSSCEVVSKEHLGYPWHDEVWEREHANLDHVSDEERMDRLHEKILASDARNIFVVCHWGTIVNYLNRFCVNLTRDTPKSGGWKARTGDYDLPPGFGKCGEDHDGMLEYLSPENCSVSTVEYL